ncbi:hypothetical protein DFH29DRAFT_1078593 [Suillus ampliporus]|nr:hypothetical protein DFH29DRAFT_1078593 [Suillus ampliporus]
MPSTASQLERSLRKLQISNSKATSNSEEWVPARRSLGRPQVALARPPPAANGHRQFFGFPITLDDLEKLGTIAYNHIHSGEKRSRLFMIENSPSFIEQSLYLPICTVARGQVLGESEDIPSECMASPTSVQLLVIWRDTNADDECPTPGQVRALERKIQRSPRWWVDYHHPRYWDHGN